MYISGAQLKPPSFGRQFALVLETEGSQIPALGGTISVHSSSPFKSADAENIKLNKSGSHDAFRNDPAGKDITSMQFVLFPENPGRYNEIVSPLSIGFIMVN